MLFLDDKLLHPGYTATRIESAMCESENVTHYYSIFLGYGQESRGRREQFRQCNVKLLGFDNERRGKAQGQREQILRVPLLGGAYLRQRFTCSLLDRKRLKRSSQRR